MKFAKKALKWLTSPFAVGLVVTLLMTYICLVYYAHRSSTMTRKDRHDFTSVILKIHQKTIDWRLNDRGPREGSDRVAILAIDERSIEQEGRWPWSRAKQAQLIDRALEYGAKSVSFDIAYTEADPSSAIPTLRKLKRGLAHTSQLTPSLGSMIDTEIGTNDGDRSFADLTRKRADRMILGTFFDSYDHTHPYRDFCTDALFERTYESRYWKKEASPLTVFDDSLNRLAFPKILKEHLAGYFTSLEVDSSKDWLERNKHIEKKMADALEDLAALIPPEYYSGIASLWLNNDHASAIEVLSQVKPAMANPEGSRILFGRIASAFEHKEAADLSSEMRKAGSDYCGRFLTENDELMSLEAYKKRWPDPSMEQSFPELSWHSLWTKLQANRQPASGPAETFDQLAERIKTQSLANSIPNVDRWWVNIPVIGDTTKHSGYFNATLDTDGTVRKNLLLVRRGNSYMPSLAFKQFLVDKGYNAVGLIDSEEVGAGDVQSKILKSLDINDAQGNSVMNIPADASGHLMINYAGGRQMFPHVSAADILSDRPELTIEIARRDPATGHFKIEPVKVDKKEFLKDKLLIAGVTAMAVFDLRVTPFEENYPGVETHANVLSNLLVEHDRKTGEGRAPASAPGFLRTHPGEEKWMWVILLGLGLMLSALLSYFGSLPGLGITAVALGGVYAIDKYHFFRSGVVTTVIFPAFEVFCTFVSLTFYKYFTEERKKRELKGTFEKYVSPAIVAEVLSDPENVELGGKKMNLTVLFSDVRGFTTFSEKLDPRQLSAFLTSYLSPMTDLVFKNKGTLDKYMGDAIMAFWGAPIHFPDHAKHACRCALQMLEKLKELQQGFRAQGLPDLDIGIGLNSGEMSVGNMGSETVRSYTVMGDSVNLGSRLEGINKQYGTRIIISEFTQKQIGGDFVTREVDWVKVKGKAQPVRIFELMAEGKPKGDTAQLLEHFNAGFALYHERKFAEAIERFNAAQALKPEDEPTRLYLERCQDYLQEPPPENWDGVFTMKEK